MVRQRVLTKEERLKANWEGMVKWWGLPDSDGNHRPPAQSNFRKEEEEFLILSQRSRSNLWDPTERVFEISGLFHRTEEDDEQTEEFMKCGRPCTTPAEYQDCLDELIGYVESIDVADELDALNSLEALFYKRVLMHNKHAGIRAKAAELVSAMVHNNPHAKRLVMEAGGLPALLYNFSYDPDLTVRIKALEALSSLIQNNKPGASEFQLNDGYVKLRDAALTSESVLLQREGLNLIQYLLDVNSSDCNIVTELKLHRFMINLASSADARVREAVFRVLLILARDEEGGKSGQLVRNDDELEQVLRDRMARFSRMTMEDLSTAMEETKLVSFLWNACYNEPSSLREKGLLVLPGEDAPGA